METMQYEGTKTIMRMRKGRLYFYYGGIRKECVRYAERKIQWARLVQKYV